MPRFNGIRVIDNPVDVLAVRRIRNTCRTFMTHNTDSISQMQQIKWYLTEYLPGQKDGRIKGFLQFVNGMAVGYGLITVRDDKFWVSGGLLPEFRGKGLGTNMFRFLTHYAFFDLHANEVWLEVRANNEPGIKTYRKIGYKQASRKDGLIVMKNTGKGA